MSHQMPCAVPRSRRWPAWVLLLLALCPPAGPVRAAEGAAGREAMADAMSRMMESMGLLGSGTGAPNAAGGGGSWDQAAEVGKRMLEGRGLPLTAAGLEGPWEAAGGGLLIVQGGNYRLYAPNGGYVDGVIQVIGQRVRMGSRRAGFAFEFEYALDQGRLALRDARGQVYVYRRLVLDGGG
ncbi:hypothetical protein [uncultured Thiodictyon sp.]|uniref:hypothetical protein n=1 Tax=uncultured Thiodictyon sp. TaxID=1846217 RepID=UPI0025E2EFAF|nr:hypothetical protein [uncultured Thiodictyon sp.]